MSSRNRQSDTTPKRGFLRAFLAAFLDGADEALRQSRREEDAQAAEDDQCRLRPAHSRLSRGYEEIG